MSGIQILCPNVRIIIAVNKDSFKAQIIDIKVALCSFMAYSFQYERICNIDVNEMRIFPLICFQQKCPDVLLRMSRILDPRIPPFRRSGTPQKKTRKKVYLSYLFLFFRSSVFMFTDRK